MSEGPRATGFLLCISTIAAVTFTAGLIDALDKGEATRAAWAAAFILAEGAIATWSLFRLPRGKGTDP